MLWALTKRQLQRAAGHAGYRIVPEDRDAQSLRRWLTGRPIRTVIDVGASRGETSREWLHTFPAARVHSIEPLPSSFAALDGVRLEFPDRLSTYNFAIGRKKGAVEFRFHPLHDTSSSLLPRTDLSAQLLPGTQEESLISVAMTTLDDLFAGSPLENDVLLKLDVQGVEGEVIAGGTETLKRVKYILTEISLAPVYVGQSDFNTVHGALAKSGFQLKGFLEQFHAPDHTAVYADFLYENPAV